MSVAWLVVGVDPQAPWCDVEINWDFDGNQLVMRPPAMVGGGRALPDVSLYVADEVEADLALGTVRRFLSALAWKARRPVEERAYHTAGARIRHGGHTRYPMFYGGPALDWPAASPLLPKGQLAQALYREARTINSIPYEFLGFFKILEVVSRSGAGRKALIRRAASTLESGSSASLVEVQARTRLQELRALDEQPEDWLYASCRCAVAHAAANPVVNPDDVADTRRLRNDTALIRAVAELVMVEELGL